MVLMPFAGKSAAVLGIGKSGIAAARFLIREGARVTILDEKSETQCAPALSLLSGLPFEFVTGFDPKVIRDADIKVLSPGISPQRPVFSGLSLTNEPSLAFQRIQAPIVAITGTSGKTTVATLIAHILSECGKKVFLGGNIGNPLLNLVLSGDKVDFVVAELSSFQIELLSPFRPRVVVYTPIESDHIDRHGNSRAYHGIKKRLLDFSDSSTTIVVKKRNPIHEGYAQDAQGKVVWYGEGKPPFELSGPLKDSAYPENIEAAILVAKDLGLTLSEIEHALQTAKPMPHRLEFVKEVRGVAYINDSKATNVLSALSALKGFEDKKVVWIAGGRNKGGDFAPLKGEVERVCKAVILMGEAKDEMAAPLSGRTLQFANTIEDATLLAAEAATSGDTVLLAPACSSLDMYENYEERGNRFKACVQSLRE